jgi:hypothetical protein
MKLRSSTTFLKVLDFIGAAGGDRTHFLVKPPKTRASIGLHKIQRLKTAKKWMTQVDDTWWPV